ncbi:DUF2235 domain-containing protein [Mycena indigotica]|uniref:DUF2235 domain-containing protein n=1 Tax=Mycena indigotica TaxID=2126181 RepID=A0A8H6TFB6_9AGAR|nr:DUF2235 domain-containing protein [Mycena indigotica]KAF7315712.1 DUF2235 domain-containing protein [Mycena indigotica]
MEAPMSDLSPRSLTFTFTLIHVEKTVNLEETDPPMNDHRTLVLGFDGTGDQFDDDNSNVVNVFSLLKKYDPSKQLVDHQLLVPGWPNFIAGPCDVGKPPQLTCYGGLRVLDAELWMSTETRFVCLSFLAAPTLWALTGILHQIGLLPKCNHQQVPFAYNPQEKSDARLVLVDRYRVVQFVLLPRKLGSLQA